MPTRRAAFRGLAALLAGSPLWSQRKAAASTGPAIEDVVNVHQFEELAKRRMHKLAYDFIAGGAEDEQTLRANREAFDRVFLVPRMMVDVSNVDTSVTLLGMNLPSPILIAPTGGKNLVMPGADDVVALAAAASNTLICSAAGAEKLAKEGKVNWWTNTTGHRTKAAAERYARGVENVGAKGIVVTVDNPYQSNRDRNSRNKFDYGYMRTGIPKPGQTVKPQLVQTPAMWVPHTPALTWDYIDWLRAGSPKMPVLLKGILAAEDARMAVERGASAIIVSNHGGRQLDGAIASLDALPEVVEAVRGRIPVLMDGGIRRGADALKALASGASAILVGRAPLWGLGAFGQAGCERVLWLLTAELKLAMALAGAPKLADIKPGMARRVG